MIVKAFEDTRIKDNQIINRNDINNYLSIKKHDLYNDIKASKISPTSIKISISSEKNYDFFMIPNFPFYGKAITYWVIDQKEFNNKTNEPVYTYTLKLSPFLTFSFDEIFNGQSIPIIQKHINELKEFEDLPTLTLKENNYFQNTMPIPGDMEYLSKKEKDQILTTNEKEIITKYYNDDFSYVYENKWVIILIDSTNTNWSFEDEDAAKIRFQSKFSDEGNTATSTLGTQNIFMIFPLTDISSVNIKIIDDDGEETLTINPTKIMETFYDDSSTLDILILDYPPNDTIYLDGDTWILDNRGGTPKTKKLKASKKLKSSEENIDVLLINYWDDRTLSTVMKTRKNLFQWEPEINEYLGTDEDNFKITNSIYLNFYPYKYFNIGIYGESNNAGWELALNNLKSLNTTNYLFTRKFNPSLDIFELIDSLEINVYYGDQIAKTKRDMFLPQYTDAWKEENKNKRLNGLSDYLLPTTGFTISALAKKAEGFRLAAMGGFALSLTNTFLNKRRIRNTPDTQTQAATESIAELIINYETRALITNEPPYNIKKGIASAFHYTGAYFNSLPTIFNNEFEEELYNIRERFNFIKIADFTSLKIFDNSTILLKETQKLILDLLQQGIHFWNFKNEWSDILKKYNFKYSIKNPIKEQ